MATALDDLEEMTGALGAASDSLSQFDDSIGNMRTSLSESGSALSQASAIVDRMEAAAMAAGVSVADMAASMSNLAEKAQQAKVLSEAKKALDDINGVKPKPVDEVTAAMQRLTKQAHDTKVLDEAKRRLGMPEAQQGANNMQKLGASLLQSAQSATHVNGVIGALQDALSKLGPAGQLAAIAIGLIVKVATAAAEALWGLVKAAVAISQEKDGLAATFDALGNGAERGIDTVNRLSELADRLPFGEEKVLKWGKALEAAGKTGAALEQSLIAIASSGAIMRDNGEAALEFSRRLETAADAGEKLKLDRRMQNMLGKTGVQASDLAKALGLPEGKLSKLAIDAGKLGDAFEKALISKGAGALNTMSLTWDSISGKLHDAWEDLFEDLGPAVQPLMTAIRDLFSEFSVGTTLQGTAKGALTSFFTTLLGWATRAISALHIVFLEIQIGALKAYIFLAPLIHIFALIFGNALVLKGIKTIFVLIGGAILGVIAGLAVMAAVFAAKAAIVIAIGSAIRAAIFAVIGAVVGLVQAFIAGGTEGAANFISGLVQGIKAGVGEVVAAVKDMASNAEAAFTSFFQIKSPSRKMMAHGRQLPAGAAIGVDDGSDDVQRSLTKMWTPKGGGAGSRARSGRGKLAETINFQFQGTRADFDEFRAYMEKWLDQQEAAGPEPEPA